MNAQAKWSPRLVGAAVGLGLIVALGVLLLTQRHSSSTAKDGYNDTVNRLCRHVGHRVMMIERGDQGLDRKKEIADTAISLKRVVGTLRAKLLKLSPDSDQVIAAVEVDEAMLDLENSLIQVNDAASFGGGDPMLARIRDSNIASARLQKAMSSLALTQCASLRFGVPISSR